MDPRGEPHRDRGRRDPVGRVATALAWAVACLACPAGCGGHEAAPRLLIVGWDGATFDLIDPLIAAGDLPNVAAMVAAGSTATLESTRIPISSAAWPTLATGKGPGEHGVYSFFRPSGDDDYGVRLVQSTDVAAPPLWRTLSRRHRIVHVWGVPLTYPPEPVHGTLVAGMLSPFDADYAQPPGLAAELRATGFVPDVGMWRVERPLDLEHIHHQLDLKERELERRLKERDWSFAMVVFKSLDVLCHNPATDLRGPEVKALLVRLDAILGNLRAAAGEDTVCMLVSDHGFASYRRTFNLHRWLVESGFSTPAGGGASVTTPPSGPLAVFKSTERAQRLATLDLDATRAFAEACEGPYGSIRLNVRDREARGPVERAEMAATMDAIERELRTLEFPAGIPVVRNVLRSADLYPGPMQDAIVPDLIVELGPEFRCVAATFGDVLGAGQAPFPDHALEGVFVLAGPGIASRAARPTLQLIDITPMALHLLDEPVPASYAGNPHPELSVTPRPVRRIADADDPSLVGADVAYGDAARAADQAEVTSRIKGSGYGD